MKREIIPAERTARSINSLRGQKVMLDFDFAALYGVTTKVLNQAAKRNRGRFPDDFMFQLTVQEMSPLRSQFVTSNKQLSGNQDIRANWSQIVTGSRKHRGQTYPPYAFTEQGVAMLSSVLNSERAVMVHIAIMRAFVKLREALETNRELSELEKRVGKHDEKIDAILEAIRQLMAALKEPRREIGFHVREKSPRYRTRKR